MVKDIKKGGRGNGFGRLLETELLFGPPNTSTTFGQMEMADVAFGDTRGAENMMVLDGEMRLAQDLAKA